MKTSALTSFRFFAAIIVVIYHYGHTSSLSALSPGLFTAGQQMVTFFFVLSGFVMVVAYGGANEVPARKYWVNRFARIAPMYFLALIPATYFYYGATPADNLTAVILCSTFLQAWQPPYSSAINVPAWSVSVEAFFYLIFPFLIAVISRYKIRPARLLVMALLAWLVTQVILTGFMNSSLYEERPSQPYELLHHFPLSHLCSFLLGIGGGYLALDQGPSKLAKPLQTLIPLGAFMLTYAAIEWRPDDKVFGFALPLGASFFAPLFLFLIYATVRYQTVLTSWLSAKPLLILGEASFGLYILQNPFHYVFSRKIEPLLGVTPDMGFNLYLLSLVATSVVLFFAFERPARATIRRMAESPAIKGRTAEVS
jgi:peptidoglycan/LPS O-acetylase OafA/YrhL